MVKKKSEDTQYDGSTDDLFNDIAVDTSKAGIDGCVLTSDFKGNVDDWIDTGVYALNGIVSGKLIGGGVPNGRVVEICGESQTGKSYFLKSVAKGAIEKGYRVVYIDTENAETAEDFARLGIDIKNVLLVHECIVEKVQVACTKVFERVTAYNAGKDREDWAKYIVIIDSLGMLQTQNEVDNTKEGKFVEDMGRRAKVIGRFLRYINGGSMSANVAVLFSNHTYADPSPFASSIIKKSGGGNKVAYVPSAAIQLTSSLDREETDDASSMSTRVYGTKVRCLAKKSRFVIPCLEIEIGINFKTGISKYSGMLDVAERLGYVKKVGQKYTLSDGTEIGKPNDFDNPEFWELHIAKIDEIFQRETALSCSMPKVPEIE